MEPLNEEDRRALYRLSRVDGLGPVRVRRLIDRFGSPTAVLHAPQHHLEQVEKIGAKVAAAIRSNDSDERTTIDFERMQRLGIQLVFAGDPEYPVSLLEIPAGPLFFTMRGSIRPEDKLAIAVVGSRRCSEYGRQVAKRLSTDLAKRGVVVVSGLARGIDGIAHRAAVEAGGRTIAVLASGIDNIYPPEHVELADDVSRHGAVISEAPIDGVPIGGLFPQRNRIISGLSLGVLVVEASERSGALSTAMHAIDQNRDVFAIPGRITDAASAGTLKLIQQGARLVTCIDDILDQLGPIDWPNPVQESQPTDELSAGPLFDGKAPSGLNADESRIWNALSLDPMEQDELAEKTGLATANLSSLLLMLEMRGIVRRLAGNRYVRLGEL